LKEKKNKGKDKEWFPVEPGRAKKKGGGLPAVERMKKTSCRHNRRGGANLRPEERLSKNRRKGEGGGSGVGTETAVSLPPKGEPETKKRKRGGPALVYILRGSNR